ncbi:amidohydrolase family protein [Luteipulveratus sp. YIM 133132]|uniref:Amidohydrolase family protein n=1 Tax=Luteipulveratus flavus TaxID=3031728 RepID=A0ABT6C664_9MICO|nr:MULTISPECIES: amidohydrolase family protein [unclassified Luteipulveratus]MDE9367877.1 amidohydrolase family protein [Luteipulveratus sp. YIM 133132]MDF8263802.1 amidohydrolase family protein [Luteipulveratus sp. YIM 133296]
MAEVLHVTGGVLVGPEDVRDELWVVDGRVSYDGPPAGADVQSVSGWVLPGLVDAHCHVGLEATGGVPPERAEEHAVADRDAGALLLRDAGSPVDTRWIDDREDLPRLIRAGRHIARTKRYIRNFAHEIEPEDLVAYVRREARRGDGWVKLVGDWIDRDTGDLSPCWPTEALKPAIEAAHAEGARVTAHCFGEQSLYDLAEAGIDCIEHATGLQTESVEMFAERGIAIVPTLVNIANFPRFAEAGESKFPEYAGHMRRLHESRYDVVSAAHEAGVRVFCGTDAGGQLPHGLVAEEVQELAKAGLSPVEAISAATWGAREWLGRPGLDEGESADLVVYQEDPRQQLGVLTQPSHIVLRGRVVR